VGDFRKAWRTLCASVGLGKMLCRSCGKVAAEGKCECGWPTTMEISGHKTAHVFRRYGIVDESDLAAVAKALEK